MTNSRHRRRKWALLLGTVVVFSLVGVYLLTSWTSPQLLSSPPPPQNYRLAFLGKYMWPIRRQLLRVKQSIFGLPQSVQVNGVIAELDPDAVVPPSNLIKGLTNDRGDKIWIADELALRELMTNTAHATVLSQPRVITADGMQAQMSMTESSTYSADSNAPMLVVGYWLNVWPHTRSARTDVTCFYTHSEMVRRPVTLADGTISSEPVAVTNAAFGAEVNVPTGASVLLLSGTTNSRGRISAVLLTPSVIPKK
jgi:hypothetical protein